MNISYERKRKEEICRFYIFAIALHQWNKGSFMTLRIFASRSCEQSLLFFQNLYLQPFYHNFFLIYFSRLTDKKDIYWLSHIYSFRILSYLRT